jgi:pyridoxine kinase
MADKRILTIQDISCVGQCSLTVALPVISACGVETCVLPSAVLSTHTGGFTGYTFRDLTDDMPAILRHWQKEGIRFDAVYTGYLGSARQISLVLDVMAGVLKPGGLRIVDPAMADNGKLYAGFDGAFVEAMKRLCAKADILLPNITEACLLTGAEYRTEYDEGYIRDLLAALSALGAGTALLTGVSYAPDRTGVAILEHGAFSFYEHRRLPGGCHGTGDIYASAFVGALMNGLDVRRSAAAAADFTVRCIENTQGDEAHWYGAKFESVLPELIERLRTERGREPRSC